MLAGLSTLLNKKTMAKSTGGTPGGVWKPTWDDKKVPPLKKPGGKPQDPPVKTAKKQSGRTTNSVNV